MPASPEPAEQRSEYERPTHELTLNTLRADQEAWLLCVNYLRLRGDEEEAVTGGLQRRVGVGFTTTGHDCLSKVKT